MAVVNRLIAAFYAVAEALIAGRPYQEIMQEYQVEHADFAAAHRSAEAFTWRGQFTAALANASRPPEILSQLRNLASLERHYEILMFQFHRAEQSCTQIRREELDFKDLFKADTFSFRIEQAAARILRDISKAELRLEKTLAGKQETEVHLTSPPPSNVAPESSEQSSSAEQSKAAEPLVIPKPKLEDPHPGEPVTSQAEPENASASNPLSDPTSQEFAACLAKHRHRVKNALPEHRPALIAKLLQLEKAKTLAPAA